MENNKSIISVEHTLLELFSGIGGFALGLQNAGFQFLKHHYYSEIDKHAIANYKHNFRNAEYIGSVQDVSGRNIKPTIITFGSPCQDFSLAGKRKGMEGQRSSLILHAIRLIRECKPHLFIWENVKGAFSSNNGEDFWGIIRAFTNIGGYRLEWQLLNTSWFLPQNRERIYLIGHLAGRSEPRVFPISKGYNRINERQYEATNIRTILGGAKSGGHHSGMTLISDSGLHRQWKKEKIVPPLRANTGAGHGNLLKIKGRLNKSRYGTGGDNVPYVNNIRRLTEIECERLQGYADDWTKFGNYDGEIKKISKTQRYKLLGNAVSVPVVEAIGKLLL
jgi:DNA (cytosine-5)-methyltransferase 1